MTNSATGFWSYVVVKQGSEYAVRRRAEVAWGDYIVVEGSAQGETRDRALWLAALLNTYGGVPS